MTFRDCLSLLRDAARYRWLRAGHAFAPEEWGLTGGKKLDEWIDESIAEGSHNTGYMKPESGE
jgi:hypothetical protein